MFLLRGMPFVDLAHPVSYTHLDVYKRQMEANGEFVLSIATARPGVLVNAPAINPTTLGVSMSKADVYKRQPYPMYIQPPLLPLQD